MEQMRGGENDKVQLGNLMQIMLAERNNEQMDDFIKYHAEDFRKYVDTNQDIFSAFKINPEEALKAIEPSLYH